MGIKQVASTLITQGVRKACYATPSCRVGCAGQFGLNIGQFSGEVVTDLFESGIKINLTRELKSTFFKPEKLKEIFAKYPHVSRRVGTLPPELAKKNW